MKKYLLCIFAVFSLLCVFALPTGSALAASGSGDCGKSKTFLGLPTWYKYLDFDKSGDCSIDMTDPIVDADGNVNEKFDFKALWLIGFAVIEMLLILAGVVALVFVFIGGFQFVTSQGSSDAIAKGRKTLANAIVGVVIAVIASRVVSFVANKLKGGATLNNYGLINSTAQKSALADILNYAFTILGAISVLVLIIAGIQFITSSGNSDKIAKARNAIYYALLGLAVAIFASAIINLIINKVAQ